MSGRGPSLSTASAARVTAVMPATASPAARIFFSGGANQAATIDNTSITPSLQKNSGPTARSTQGKQLQSAPRSVS